MGSSAFPLSPVYICTAHVPDRACWLQQTGDSAATAKLETSKQIQIQKIATKASQNKYAQQPTPSCLAHTLLCQGVLHKLPVDAYSQIAPPRSCCRGAVLAYLVECVSTVNTEVR